MGALPKVTHTVKHHGHPIELTGLGSDTQTAEWKAGRFYEAKLLHEIEKMKLKGVYVDVGANFGNHSVFFSRFCPSTKVISVEPYCEALIALKINLAQHVKDKSVLVEKFVGDHVGRAAMFKTSMSPGSARVKEYKEDGEVEVDTLDNILRDTQDIVVIKLDVEGVGVEALRGASMVLASHKPVVIAECFRKGEFEAIDAELKLHGYTTDGHNWCASRTCIWAP